ncbi:MAG: excisionase family DNA-binding protein [Bifidobacteriaceae bacterium]|jgi:excisionase family DNA binding protein|nr:excisionase family DNA-binding protein [Bifidobacteriaceae bacterium]
MDTTTVASSDTVLPPDDASSLAGLLETLDPAHGKAALVGPDGERVELPDQVHDALTRVVKALRQGCAVTVAPVSMRLTTSQAAEMLGVSRPTFVRLLDDGEIPYDRPRRHRLVRLDDVLAFKERRRAGRRALLAEARGKAAA